MAANIRTREDETAADHLDSDFQFEDPSKEKEDRQIGPTEDVRLSEEVVGFPFLHSPVVGQADQVTQFCKTEQAPPQSVDHRVLFGTDIKEMPEYLSDQAMLKKLDQLRGQIHVRASFIHSLCFTDETSSKYMLDQLRKGAYDAALSYGDRLHGKQGLVSRDCPWEKKMRGDEQSLMQATPIKAHIANVM